MLKNLSIGFLVSFIGSIPLGYLNVIGLQFYQENHITPLITYLIGVVLIEVGVIYLTLKGASRLAYHHKWKKAISLFSIAFLFILSYSFYEIPQNETTYTAKDLTSLQFAPILVGLLLSALNVAQFPFWFSWNLYLINQKYIDPSKKTIPFFLLGAAIGTFLGMLVLILSIHKTIDYTQTKASFFNYLWVLFLGLGIIQLLIFIKKLYKSKLHDSI